MSRTTSIRLVSLFVALGAIAGVSSGQQVLSAQSGTIHYIEGPVYVDGQQLRLKFGQFPTLRPGQELRTEAGQAEVLLTPGVFLRIADHSAVRMVDNRLSDTRIEVVGGSVIAECDALLKDNAVTLLYAGNTIHLDKHGLYRVDTAPAQLRVYDGEALVESASGQLTVKRGKETPLNGVLVAEKFNRRMADSFLLWDADRSALLAAVSANASQSLLNNKSSWSVGGWGWSPYYNMYTFVPGGGAMIFSPFGWQFWSPALVSVYYPYSNGGYGNGGRNSGGSTLTGGVSSGGVSSGGGSSVGGGRVGGAGPTSGGGGFGGGGFSGGGGGGGGARGGGGGGGAAAAPAGGGHGR